MAKPYDRTLLPQVLDDLRALAASDEALIDVALQAITDVAEHRKTGKVLGARNVSGDLTRPLPATPRHLVATCKSVPYPGSNLVDPGWVVDRKIWVP